MQTIWPLHDYQGNVLAAFSPTYSTMANPDQNILNANPVQNFEYDSFGALKTNLGPLWANRLQILHAGRSLDDFTGFYYNNARWYDPKMKRFISQDPIGYAGGDTNLYCPGPTTLYNQREGERNPTRW